MIVEWIKWVLLITGIITAGLVSFYIAPGPMMRIGLGFETDRKDLLSIVRHWGLLIGLVGGLLIWAAFEPDLRMAAMLVAGLEKLGMIAVVITHRKESWTQKMWPAVIFDTICVILYAWWMLAMHAA